MIMESPRVRYYTPQGTFSDCPECCIGESDLLESEDEKFDSPSPASMPRSCRRYILYYMFYAAFM